MVGNYEFETAGLVSERRSTPQMREVAIIEPAFGNKETRALGTARICSCELIWRSTGRSDLIASPASAWTG